MLSSAYRFLTDLGAPVIGLYLLRRRAQGREDAARFRERLGFAALPRPQGRLVWCHAASVGEAASLLALIEKLRTSQPETSILITTGTVTSARMLEGRLPPGVMHQYVPVDRIPYVRRFLDHWKPDLVIWIESELWPNMLAELRARQVPAVLLNARMSEKSFHNWLKARDWAKEILSTFDLCLTQTDDERGRFAALGARNVRTIGNLKYAAKPLPVDEDELGRLRGMTAGRTQWGMVSTHRGEEDIALGAHKQLRAQWPSLLTVIVPRHAARGDEIAQKVEAAGLKLARRSKAETIAPETDIYLADTMGELGLFYRLSPIAVVGGSFVPMGGHNPVEPAHLGAAIVFGPHMHNFSAVAREFVAQKAAIQLQHENELAFTVDRLLNGSDGRVRYTKAALMLAQQKRHVLEDIMEALAPFTQATGKAA